MAKTMKAAVVREFGKPLVIEAAPLPTVGPGQILAIPTCTRQKGTGRSNPTRPSFLAMKASGMSPPSVRASPM